MSVTDVGTPSLQQSTGAASPKTQAGAWGTGQNRTAGNLLVALITAEGQTSASAITQNGTQDWTKIAEGAGSTARAAIWAKPAAGSDTAPTFQSTLVGTNCRISVELFELNDSTGNLPELDVSNAASGTSGTLTVTTATLSSSSVSFALAVQSMQAGSSASNTWSQPGSWTTVDTDGTTSFNHFVTAKQANPTPSATLSYAPTHTQTSSGIGGAVAVFKPGRYTYASTIATRVSATPTGATGCGLRVLVLTNALESGGATATADGNPNGAGGSISLTPNGSHSLVIAAIGDTFSSTSYAAVDANSSVLDNFSGSGLRMGSVKYIGTVTSGTPVVPGVVNNEGASFAYFKAAQEILSADGSNTPAIDPSGVVVASASSGSTVKTTTLFVPPPGAVLLAVCMGGGSNVSAWTISDTASLTWTQRANEGNQRFYTATVPSGDAGTGSIAMHKMGVAATGWAPDIGTGSIRMHKMGVSASGVPKWVGTGSIAMHKMGISGTLRETEFGTGSIAMHKMGLSGTAEEIELGTGSIAMHKMGVAGTGTLSSTDAGTGSVAMNKMGLAGTAKEVDFGAGHVSMHKMGLSGSGVVTGNAGSIRMHKMGLSGAGRGSTSGSIHISMHKMGLSGQGITRLHGSGSVRMHKPGIRASNITSPASSLFIFTPV